MASADRIDLRVDTNQKKILKRAAALSGSTLTQYVVSTAVASAEKAIENHADMTLEDDIFDRFANACEQAQSPNQALREALVFTQESGFQIDAD